jgi:hypothetical protein
MLFPNLNQQSQSDLVTPRFWVHHGLYQKQLLWHNKVQIENKIVIPWSSRWIAYWELEVYERDKNKC